MLLRYMKKQFKFQNKKYFNTKEITNKDIETICAMKDSNYEEEYSNRGSYRNGYSRNYSYEMVPRMNQGGYSNNYSNNYSGSSMLVSKLHNLMNEASNDRERMMIQTWLNEVEK